MKHLKKLNESKIDKKKYHQVDGWSPSSIQTHPHQIQFRCNLINGYIDSRDEVFKYLDWANELGINDVGLVSLMPVNDYAASLNFFSNSLPLYLFFG